MRVYVSTVNTPLLVTCLFKKSLVDNSYIYILVQAQFGPCIL